MNTLLDIFNTEVTKKDNTITVTYCHLNYSGYCIYEECLIQGTTKRFKQRIQILKETNMEDIIECLYKLGKVTGPQDLQTISYDIQTHSRRLVESKDNENS